MLYIFCFRVDNSLLQCVYTLAIVHRISCTSCAYRNALGPFVGRFDPEVAASTKNVSCILIAIKLLPKL